MEFNVRVSKTHVTLTTVPKGYGKPGFLKRLPAVLAKRSKGLVEEFLETGLDSGTYRCCIDKNRNGKYVVGNISFGNRSGKSYTGVNEVVTKTKILINRENGLGIRMCFIPNELDGKRVNIAIRV